MTDIFDSADMSSILAAAIRLHDVTRSRVVRLDLVRGAVEDYQAGHPEFECLDPHFCYLTKQVSCLLIGRIKDSGEIGEMPRE